MKVTLEMREAFFDRNGYVGSDEEIIGNINATRTYNVQELAKDFVKTDRDFLDSQEPKIGQYHRKCKGIFIDVYDVIKAFNVTNPASQHAIKKMLASGQRGVKDFKQDLREAIQALERAIELGE